MPYITRKDGEVFFCVTKQEAKDSQVGYTGLGQLLFRGFPPVKEGEIVKVYLVSESVVESLSYKNKYAVINNKPMKDSPREWYDE